MTQPITSEVSNLHFVDNWNCPACYAVLPDVLPGQTACPECGSKVELTVEHFPASVARLVEPANA